MYTFIFDIGKTNIKGYVLNENSETVWTESQKNVAIKGLDYTYIDVENVETWLLSALKKANAAFNISAINISTHGACAVLIGQDNKLLMPVMDYECDTPEQVSSEYDVIRPTFNHSFSPNLSAGLNLGRQLWWLKKHQAEAFASVKYLFMYPQYWVWKLTGIAVNEVTSLGCHTDLWLPEQQEYSSLVDKLGIRQAMPPLVAAYESVGSLSQKIQLHTGINNQCKVFAGIHDSNASFACYLSGYLDNHLNHSLKNNMNQAFTVVSTGTWVIAMSMGGDIKRLHEEADMLANVCVLNQAIACARFMGGREFELICQQTNAQTTDEVSVADIQSVIDQTIFALPAFAAGSGPFRGAKSQISAPPANGKALATLYLALMIDYQLSQLDAKGDIIFGSTSKKNPLMCRIIAQLRPQQNVVLSGDSASTVKGAWVLTNWQAWCEREQEHNDIAVSPQLANLHDYKAQWLAVIKNKWVTAAH